MMATGLLFLGVGLPVAPLMADNGPAAYILGSLRIVDDTTLVRIVRGSVLDKTGKGLEFSTIHLLRHSDSTHVVTVVSDESGRFEFSAVRTGDYLLKATQLSYVDAYSPSFRVEAGEGPVMLPPLIVTESSLRLGEVVVVGQKQLIERQIDRFVVNVDAMPAAAGGSVYDVLKNSPGVTVNSTESISMMGKTGVVVMIDDRPVKMSSDALLNMLKNMPAESISSLEVITTPPARYEAEGDAGLINIRTKRRKTEGWNAELSVRGGKGQYTRYGGGAVLNVKQGIFDFNGSYFVGHATTFQNITQRAAFRRAGQADAFSNVLSQTYLLNKATSHDAKVQMDVKTGERSALGLVVTAFSIPNSTRSDNSSVNQLRTVQLDTTVNTFSKLSDDSRNYSMDGYYKTALDTLGRELSVDANYARFASDKDQHFTNLFFLDPNPTGLAPGFLRSYFSGTTSVRSLKADLLLPYAKYKVEGGAKYSWVRSASDFLFQKELNDIWISDPLRTNQFDYRETIYAAYLSAGRKWTKFSFQAGLRTEYTRTNGKSNASNIFYVNNYFKLFPTLYLQYAVSDAYQTNISYSRRIGRPPYNYLNPFLSYLSQYFSNQGNPFLQPSFTHSVEWANVFKSGIVVSSFANYTSNFFSEFPRQRENSQEVTYTFANLGTSSSYGVTVIVPLSLAEWWKVSDNVTVYDQRFASTYPEAVGNTQKLVYNLSLSNSFTITPHITAQLSGYYNSPSIQGLYVTVPYYAANVGTTVKMLKDQATLGISLSDLFYTERGQATARYTNQDFSFRRKEDSRILRLSFAYKLGNRTIKAKKTRENASQSELDRAGQ